MEQETAHCQNCRKDFVIEQEDLDFYEKVSVPPPTFCWQCRFQRRCAYRNERSLKRAKSARSGKDILTLYPPDAGLTLYDTEEWYADDWNDLATGRDYDFSRTFFEQLFELGKEAPVFARNVVQNTNSDYCSYASYTKNSYLLFQTSGSEDCAYGNAVDFCKNCYDNSHIMKSEKCYDSFWLTSCYQAYFSVQCLECSNVWFSKNCRGCDNCVGCVNLTKQKYCIFNQQYSKEEYEKRVSDMKLGTHSGVEGIREEAEAFWLKFPNRFMQGVKNDNVTGEYINNSKNCRYCYLVREGKDLKYCQYQQIPKVEDCYDITIWGENNQLSYETMGSSSGMHMVKFCSECHTEVRDLEYCMSCVSCTNLFGCIGLRKKEYCILNKQYTKGEYEALRARIIDHMNAMPYTDKKGCVYKYGEFFPIELSYYGANTDLMNDHFPMTKDEAVKQGYAWKDIDKREYETTMKASDIPDAVADVKDDITKEIIECEECRRAYRVIVNELGFLRNEGLPAPRRCVECRHRRRIAHRNRTMLYDRACDCRGTHDESGVYKNSSQHAHEGRCPNEFKTSYTPHGREIVYCEGCYQAEVS